jgi:DNA modification methylase
MKVLDLMTGSGTTAIAAKKLRRQFAGIEINENQYKIAKSNIATAISLA